MLGIGTNKQHQYMLDRVTGKMPINQIKWDISSVSNEAGCELVNRCKKQKV